MKLRLGRRNPLNIYLQLGDQAADTDPPLAVCVAGAAAARDLVEITNTALDRGADAFTAWCMTQDALKHHQHGRDHITP